MYADEIVIKFAALYTKIRNSPNVLFSRAWEFTISDGEFVSHNFDFENMVSEFNKFECFDMVNSIEAFAMFFVDGIADDEVGFRETASNYCSVFRDLAPLFWMCRVNRNGDFRSATALYEIWSERLKIEEMRKQKETLDEGLKRVNVRKLETVGLEKHSSRRRKRNR